MFEDNLVSDYVGSKSSLQKKSKLLAVGVIQRSWAWGALLADEFPNAIRLSIHPQPATSLKIGIHMMPTQDCWMTPWHGVAVKIGEKYVLMSRHAAQLCGAQLVMEDESPSHYILETPNMQNAMMPEKAV
jgi:pyoverdine/dityrosine biosynthesis protein Dit1